MVRVLSFLDEKLFVSFVGYLEMSKKAKIADLEFAFGWRELAVVLIAGICIAVGLGFLENSPGVWFRNIGFYGYPLVWRLLQDSQVEYRWYYLLADIAFWVSVVFMLTAIVKGVGQKLES